MCQVVKDLGLPSGYLHVAQITGVEKARFFYVFQWKSGEEYSKGRERLRKGLETRK